tara:strand:+ start:1977 stop:2312 length:336 start_codon:yes stop_codon:yes gene_type:complete
VEALAGGRKQAEDIYESILAMCTEKELKLRQNFSHINYTRAELIDWFNHVMPFSMKKQYTSAARRFLPIGMVTKIGWSCNIRALRHVLMMRTHPSAEEEIRFVFAKIGLIA